MSKKSVVIPVPDMSFAQGPGFASGSFWSPDTRADEWVHHHEMPAMPAVTKPAEAAAAAPEPVPSTIMLTISGEPNWFEAYKLAFMVPQLTLWAWTLGVAERNLRLLTRTAAPRSRP
jgi:hypothetical protein